MFDLGAIGLAIVSILVLLLVGSRFFPENMLLSPWRYRGRHDDSTPGIREDDDVRFDWGPHEPNDGDDP